MMYIEAGTILFQTQLKHCMNNVPLQDLNSFDNLLEEACLYLRENLSYSPATISVYHKFWKRLSRFMKQSSYTKYDKFIGEKFLLSVLGEKKPLQYNRFEKNLARSIRFMDEYSQETKITTFRETEDFSSNIGQAIESFLFYRKHENRLSPLTLHDDQLYMSKLVYYLNIIGITEVGQLDLGVVINFLQSLNTSQRAMRSSCIMRLRRLFSYWFEHGIITVNLARQMPNDVYRQQAKLPSVYTKSEISAMLDNIDRSSGQGKRDYAILMLLSRYGLRASDICRLKLEDIHWAENNIAINQYKTGNRLELPLLKDVGEAIIDYLKYGRQISTLPNVFLRLKSPYGQMSSGSIYDAVNKAMRFAAIKSDRRRHGSHVFRHSLASLLLKEQSVLPVISEVLGHASTDSTKTYMRIDMDSLRKCTLDVPAVAADFYTQKGNCFYE